MLSADRLRPGPERVVADVLRALRGVAVVVVDAPPHCSGRRAAPDDPEVTESVDVLVVPLELRGVAGAVAALQHAPSAGPAAPSSSRGPSLARGSGTATW
ncbi:hypothetical protein GCM10025865_08020 [Paraoerskovia sediminicola]|uniref:Uncharacterized protein n=1 Tax=Paraoerskovia sediminicola TaxID=1138587 RepID=A0ABN6X9K1_9CELL|nr:hypothetical protein [Paraoerskovia sediminicola]BDZ41503.1 hypothetical protein GCM10025865_08020 [Paraoerskovia sediminicola]